MNPVLQLLIGPVLDLISKFIPDPQKQAELKVELLQLQATEEFKQLDAMVALAQSQTDTNKAEAATGNWFLAGWRPAVGWTCAVAFAINFVVAPLATWIAALLGHPVKFPQLDTNTLLTVLLGMLGLGTMRTVEKVQGVATDKIGK